MCVCMCVCRHFSSKDAMDIQGLGPKLIEQLYTSGHVRRLIDLYSLAERHHALLIEGEASASKQVSEWDGEVMSLQPLHELPGRGVQSTSKLFASIEKSRNAATVAR